MCKLTRKQQCTKNKDAKIGDTIVCPVCKTKFIKKHYQQTFCCSDCKNKYWNDKGDRHKDPEYHNKYNRKYPERLERIGIYEDNGELGYFDDYGYFHYFKEDYDCWAMCEDPIMGI